MGFPDDSHHDPSPQVRSAPAPGLLACYVQGCANDGLCVAGLGQGLGNTKVTNLCSNSRQAAAAAGREGQVRACCAHHAVHRCIRRPDSRRSVSDSVAVLAPFASPICRTGLLQGKGMSLPPPSPFTPVPHLDHVARAHEDVGGLDVTVDHTRLVDGLRAPQPSGAQQYMFS